MSKPYIEPPRRDPRRPHINTVSASLIPISQVSGLEARLQAAERESRSLRLMVGWLWVWVTIMTSALILAVVIAH